MRNDVRMLGGKLRRMACMERKLDGMLLLGGRSLDGMLRLGEGC
jgi:hypothetical protein